MSESIEQNRVVQKNELEITLMDTPDLSEASPIQVISSQWRQIVRNILVLISPGDNNYKDVSKRFRLMVISFIIPFLLFSSKIWIIPADSPSYVWFGVSFVLSIVTYFALCWGFKCMVRKEAKWSILPIGSIFVFASSIFITEIFTGALNRVYLWGLFVLAIGIFMIGFYILSLAINILNVHLFYAIPMSRLGESIIYIFSIVSIFMITLTSDLIALPLIISGNIQYLLILILGMLFVTLASVSFLILYFIPFSKGFWGETFAITIAILLSNLVAYVVFPVAWYSALFSAIFSYVIIGHIIHKQQGSLKKTVNLEYIALLIVLLVFILL